MPEGCDAACEKIIIDTGMAVFAAADVYAGVLDDFEIKGAGRRIVDFYISTVDLFAKVAQWLNSKHLTEEQRSRLMEQIDKMCYRSDILLNWSFESESTIRDRAGTDWRDAIRGWSKDDQNVFTALVGEINEHNKH